MALSMLEKSTDHADRSAWPAAIMAEFEREKLNNNGCVGSTLLSENDKVRVWNYTWLPGKPTPMHFHNTEVVVVYLGNGDIAATTPDGKKTVNHHNPGDIVFNLANRSHAEELTQGEMSGVMLELK